MNVRQLIQMLSDPDPYRRVQVLRVLAMVEETRALSAINHIYKNDPEPGVREVARWAGSIIWQAHQRGYSTEQGMNEFFKGDRLQERQQLLVDSVIDTNAKSDKNLSPMLEQAKTEWKRLDTLSEKYSTSTDVDRPLLPKPGSSDTTAQPDDDDLKWLDAGLTDL